MTTTTIVQVFMLSALYYVKGNLLFTVSQNGTKCEPACQHSMLLGSPSIECCSIENIAREFGSNTSNVTIYLSGAISVYSLALFKNISFLSIHGVSKSKPSLVCTDHAVNSKQQNAGLRFEHVENLVISNIVITGCGGDDPLVIKTAVTIIECSNILLTNTTITKSNGTSLFIQNSSGDIFLNEITVANSKAEAEFALNRTSFSRGVFIYISSSKPSHYRITNSVFERIATPRYGSYDVRMVKDTTDWLGYGLGGGLSILFDFNSTQNFVSVENCFFQHNYAPWGAGMYIRFQKNSTFNSVTILSSYFQYCEAKIAGAGLAVGTVKKVVMNQDQNIVFVKNSVFKRNHALYGAGTSVYALHTDLVTKKGEFVTFHNCSWIENTGRYSPAVDIAPTRFDHLGSGALPIPVFRDCSFLRNRIVPWKPKYHAQVSFGVFVVTKFTVSFVGTFLFESNAHTALLLNSGKVILEENTQVQFVNNTGSRGGAVSLNGFAVLSVSNNCTLEFYNNSATEYGGALFYYPIEQRELFEGRVCFLQYNGLKSSPVQDRNIRLVFADNFASVSGASIYSTSLFSCYFSYRGSPHGHQADEFLFEIGNITFSTSRNRSNICSVPQVGTSGYYFTGIADNLTLRVFPGKQFTLHPLVKDDLNQVVNSEFFVRIEKKVPKSISPFLHSPYTVNRSVILYGTPNERARLVVSTQHIYRSIQYKVDVVLLSCPPGYYYENFTCWCSAGSKLKAYAGITDCNQNNFTAVIERGYWAGYYNNSTGELYTATCPFAFCVLNTLGNYEHSLPNSSDTLSSFMCGPTRQGVLCGECVEGFTVYYHSMSFTCGPSDKCSYGAVFFILSELLPVFIFFTLVIVLDISFSSGSRNGFIFFCQMVTILPLDYISLTDLPVAQYLQSGYKLIYGVFNIEFFTVESLSFCLFRNATVMDILAFKYVSTVFAFILVIFLTISMNYCTCCDKLCSVVKKKLTTKESVLHGISAFLVICYIESVRVSFFILRLKPLKGPGGVIGPIVAFFGGTDYFKGKHILYAVPAMLTLGTIAFFPPMLLLLYPNTLKLLQFCKLSEHRFVLAILKVTKINSIMPLFDVFQGHFKDNLRFFAGLFFLYRVALLASYSFSQSISEYTIAAELVLLLVLSFHSTAHPYKQNNQNVIDSLLLSNLAIINGLSLAALKILQGPVDKKGNILLYFIISLQLFLIYLPILLLSSRYICRLCRYAQHKLGRNTSSEQSDESEVIGYLEYLDEGRNSEQINLVDVSENL